MRSTAESSAIKRGTPKIGLKMQPTFAVSPSTATTEREVIGIGHLIERHRPGPHRAVAPARLRARLRTSGELKRAVTDVLTDGRVPASETSGVVLVDPVRIGADHGH